MSTKNNNFKFDWLPEGLYIFNGYLDLNNDKKWSPGNINPFQFAEPVFNNNDTIRVRKRWETSDVMININGW